MGFPYDERRMTNKALEDLAEDFLDALIDEGHDVFYFSIGLEHKMRSDAYEKTGTHIEISRSARKRFKYNRPTGRGRYALSSGTADENLVRSFDVHTKVFPNSNRMQLMRAANHDNSQRFEPILINTAHRYQQEGKIKVLINKINPRVGKAVPANLEKGLCNCSIYSEVWVSFTSMEILNKDGIGIV